MNELDWRRQMHALATPVEPARDLWPDIATAIRAPQPAMATSTRRASPPWAAAAAVVLACGTAVALYTGQPPAATGVAATWHAKDPRLTAAAIGLDAAHGELTAALRLAPDSASLQRILSRTERQRARLASIDHRAG